MNYAEKEIKSQFCPAAAVVVVVEQAKLEFSCYLSNQYPLSKYLQKKLLMVGNKKNFR